MNLNKYIDHTLLKPEATKEAILKLIDEAKQYDFCSVCINPAWVSLAAKELKDTDVKVCTVIGFDLGATTTASKAFETANAVENGADEVDMVINVGFLKSKEYDLVKEDIAEVVKAANGKIVKVIIETCLLTDEEIVKVCQLSKEAGADFVKTSTGFNSGGATVEDVKLMKETVGEMLVKASGGIRDLDTALKMIEAGADRLGVSAGIQIIEEYKARNAN
ncbi:deoxyribose-phosphate aldolase [Peptoniphilus asaccharolyticus DSM 20463]|uniref:Deoxyribose-phosphate aldolase n=1 Tax=Peptoniphilus asaccharolyticus DSM 20463 TaxID=573058 RepID=A0A1W1UKK5_PEPAS|nr:deoxyribose-phosphate aldolase [Peptoniphilus asaccharolyticus]MBL7574846.1 deoxyribose-phosphate aldolase [Peptoniphilus asaccharolyticus]SMB81553.1 deoxyribose-phosphate aldolase [Peptoniphilus asaccharolyticus DSM 20463]